MIESGKMPADIIKEKGMMQITDESSIEGIVDEVIAENPQVVESYDPANPKALDYFIGQVMKKTRGRANPSTTYEMLKSELESK